MLEWMEFCLLENVASLLCVRRLRVKTFTEVADTKITEHPEKTMTVRLKGNEYLHSARGVFDLLRIYLRH